MIRMHRPIAAVALAVALLLAAPAARAYHDNAHGRAIFCASIAYGLVELVLVATKNVEWLAADAEVDARAAGHVRTGALAIQARALEEAANLEKCLTEAVAQAVRDPAAAYATQALTAEVDGIGNQIAAFEKALADAQPKAGAFLARGSYRVGRADVALPEAAKFGTFAPTLHPQVERIRSLAAELAAKSK